MDTKLTKAMPLDCPSCSRLLGIEIRTICDSSRDEFDIKNSRRRSSAKSTLSEMHAVFAQTGILTDGKGEVRNECGVLG